MIKIIDVGRLVVLCIWLLGLSACTGSARADETLEGLVIRTAAGKEINYRVEIADTDPERRQGLMFRMEMQSNHGMLLDFGAPQKVAIWMKNTYIPLDIIYIDAQGVITRIVPDAVPHSTAHMGSDGPVRAVLELNAGQAAYHEFKAGDRVLHRAFK